MALLGVSVLGLLGLIVTANGDKRELAFTIGVVPTGSPAAALDPGDTVCQSPISVPESFSRVGLRTGGKRAGEPLAVTVRAANGNRVLGKGEIPGGFPDQADLSAAVGPVASGQRVAVCVRNTGNRVAFLYGNASGAALPSEAKQGGSTLGTDMTILFLNDRQRSMLSELPEVFERASLFRPGWVGAWTFWALTAAAFLGVPVLLGWALAATGERPASEAAPDERSARAP